MNKLHRASQAALTAILVLVVSVAYQQTADALPINGQINVRTTTVGPAGPLAPDPGIANDFAFANKIYNQIGLTVNKSGADRTLVLADPGGNGSWSSAEVANTLLGNNDNTNNRINTYYVPSFGGAGNFGQAWSQEDVTNGNSVAIGAVMDAPTRRNDTFAHEIGHILLDRWRWRAQEGFGGGGIHSGTANDLMASGNVPRNIPANLNAVWPTGTADQIGKNVGPTSASATDTIPQISAMYYQNAFVAATSLNADNITVNVEAASASFNWGVQQTIGGLRVNQVARRTGNHTEEFMFHFRNTAGFGAGSGGANGMLDLAMNDISSLDTAYEGFVTGSMMIQVGDDILNNPVNLTTLTPITDYTFGFTFNNVTDTLDFGQVHINDALLTGNRDIFVMFSMQTVPEPSTWAMAALGLVGLVLYNRRRKTA
ncbi:MAG: PEP-CTERM sorting domain-containing protein [Planctomycetota bacterium]|nr:MAG: PEP-CTERM sorting domain-containing protein [Planctomycetota bacterium]REJ89551.1 MAG: PEP-CTERM sorting domain-containing protein [Planctomycetota bacterium]REK31414.1 MAG: PEP-CTERM sorting domain-containing protein [Planctomycetota bacterium]REK40644.1 MAG: PEP-CTERM sorting domain-containing protein [Planctomycetota bacterium]